MSTKVDLSGKWRYSEDYGYGLANGELHISQEGTRVKGRIIFTDSLHEEESFMIQEFVEGVVINNKFILDATEWDLIHSESEIEYELDSWCGDIVTDSLIQGKSVDEQGIEGKFEFEKIK